MTCLNSDHSNAAALLIAGCFGYRPISIFAQATEHWHHIGSAKSSYVESISHHNSCKLISESFGTSSAKHASSLRHSTDGRTSDETLSAYKSFCRSYATTASMRLFTL